MIRITLLGLLLTLGVAAIPASGQEKVKTSVDKVTLFIDGAQVTRTKQIALPAGNSTIVFTGLSPYMDDKSMQVSAKGRFTVTAVNRLFNHTDSLERTARQKTLEAQITATEQQRKKLLASREILEAETELLKVNCSVGNRNVATSLAAIKELNEYYSTQAGEIKQKLLALDEQTKALNLRERQLREEIAQLGGRQSAPMSEVEVRIEAPAACTGQFTLTYYVRNAGWFPSYDIRSEGLTAPLEIAYKANIFQNTKEEWKNVALTLSSSNPNIGNIAPQLKTYWLDYGLTAPRYNVNLTNNTVSGVVFDNQRDPLPGANIMIPGTTVGTTTDANGRYSLTIPAGAESLQFTYIGYTPRTTQITGSNMNITLEEDSQQLDEVVVVAYGAEKMAAKLTGSTPRRDTKMALFAEETEILAMAVEQTQNRLGYEFEIKQPYSVPSDGKTTTAEIGRYQLPAVYGYQSTPKIDKDAFLVAETADWEKLNLLQGEANVYFENTFVGKSILDPGQASDTLRFSMGRDRGLLIERTLETDRVSRKSIGSNQTQTLSWKFTVRNTRPEAVCLTLCDQLPVSRNSAIVVTGEELSGGELDKKSGTVTWKLDLKPGEQRELRLQYGVKYPKAEHLIVE